MRDPRGWRSALHRAPVLGRPVGDDGVQRRALLADAAPRGDEVRVAALVREGVGRAPRRRAPAKHVLPPLPLLLGLQPLAMLLDLQKVGEVGRMKILVRASGQKEQGRKERWGI